MKILLTGATGYIGSVIAEKLSGAGHQVVGLARSDASAKALEARGLEVVRGDLGLPQSLADAARTVDGVINAAGFQVDGADFFASLSAERRALGALISGLGDDGKPLIHLSGTAVLGDTGTQVFDEETPPAPSLFAERIETENDVLEAKGVRGIVLRPPNVYGRSDGRAVLAVLRMAGQSLGALPYATGTADNKWSFVHVDDLADLFVLALDKAKAGELFHTGAEAGLRTGAIAQAVSRSIQLEGKTVEMDIPALGEALGVPPLAPYWASNSQSSSEKARRLLGWQPKHEQMLQEIAQHPV